MTDNPRVKISLPVSFLIFCLSTLLALVGSHTTDVEYNTVNQISKGIQNMKYTSLMLIAATLEKKYIPYVLSIFSIIYFIEIFIPIIKVLFKLL